MYDIIEPDSGFRMTISVGAAFSDHLQLMNAQNPCTKRRGRLSLTCPDVMEIGLDMNGRSVAAIRCRADH